MDADDARALTLPREERGFKAVSQSPNPAKLRPALFDGRLLKLWEVKDRKGKVRFIARSRSQCLEWEPATALTDLDWRF